jgi:DNA replication and repair protein RecF
MAEAFLNYELEVYICKGTKAEQMEWFRTINIAGEELYPQELRNASYVSKWLTDAKKYFSKAKEMYKNCLNKDIEKTFTTIGIHKDDFKVYLNDLQIDMYASQGQQRLIALCMKLAVFEIVKKANKEEPIIILDDAFSELDKQKKNKLFNYVLAKQQVFITCTDYKNIVSNQLNKKITLFHIAEGNVKERSSI